MAEYKVNPYAVLGSGLAGLGLGGVSYLLSPRKTTAGLLTNLLLGAGLGAGTGALLTLDKKKSVADVKKDKEREVAKDKTDEQLENIIPEITKAKEESSDSYRVGTALGLGGAGRLWREVRAVTKEPKRTEDALKYLEARRVGKGKKAKTADIMYHGTPLKHNAPEIIQAFGNPRSSGRKFADIYGDADMRQLAKKLAKSDYLGNGLLGRTLGWGRSAKGKLGAIANLAVIPAGYYLGDHVQRIADKISPPVIADGK